MLLEVLTEGGDNLELNETDNPAIKKKQFEEVFARCNKEIKC